MKNVKVIIGANFGDEGKGLMTNYFASTLEHPIVVRFNGGAQAGHTIIHEGKRIVFSHFNSATSLDAPTYLAEEFICNPILFNKEYDELVAKGLKPMVVVNPNCRITTPFDMIINQEIEKARGDKRHGSCGVGVFETVKRSKEFYKLTIKDLSDLDKLKQLLKNIKTYWVDSRATELRLMRLPMATFTDKLIDRYIEDCKLFRQRVIVDDDSILYAFDDVVFEGAQGLLLDWDADLIYATPSYTGLTNVVEILKKFPSCPTEVCYVTRPYFTRHGAGPLETECEKPYPNIVDETNQPNEWQGTLRFGLLDINLLGETIEKDFKQALPHFTKSLAISCMDQVEGNFKFLLNGQSFSLSERTFRTAVKIAINPSKMYNSYGPSRENVSVR